MSRIGNNPVKLPPKVEVTLGQGEITVKGPLGSLTRKFGDTVSIAKDGEQLVFKAATAEDSAMQGTLRALVANMVKGVTDGYQRKLTSDGRHYFNIVDATGEVIARRIQYFDDATALDAPSSRARSTPPSQPA